MTADNKDILRKEAQRHRVLIDPRTEHPDDAAPHFFEAIKPRTDQIVASYWPKEREFDPGAIMEQLLKNGNKCALPVVERGSRVLKFARWEEGVEMTPGPYDVMQPVDNGQTEWLEPDIVIVPLLAFDRRGYRLGYGGGYYDATLKALRAGKDILAVGVAYAQQACLFNLPVEEHDEPLDWVVTPKGAQNFKE